MQFDCETITLANGLRIVRAPEPASDIVALRVIVDAGQGREPKPGVSHLVGRTLACGAGAYDEEQLTDALERHGIALETSGVGFGVKALGEDATFATQLTLDLLRNPHFEAEAVTRERELARADLQAESDLVRARATRSFLRAIYGDHPLGGDPRGVPEDISRRDLLDYHAAFFAPNETVIGVAGRIDVDRLAHALEDWPRTKAPPRRRDYPIPVARTIELEGEAEQSHLFFGHLGVDRLNPQWHALRVLDHVLGTGPGFTDRLSRRIRDELGLVYNVSASISPTAGRSRGLFQMVMSCAREEAERAIHEALATLREICTTPVTHEEIEAAKTFLASSYVFDFVSAEDMAMAAAAHLHFDLGVDYPRRYLAAVAAVDSMDLLSAAQQHLHPDALILVRT